MDDAEHEEQYRVVQSAAKKAGCRGRGCHLEPTQSAAAGHRKDQRFCQRHIAASVARLRVRPGPDSDSGTPYGDGDRNRRPSPQRQHLRNAKTRLCQRGHEQLRLRSALTNWASF
jgi:hypothetical protein